MSLASTELDRIGVPRAQSKALAGWMFATCLVVNVIVSAGDIETIDFAQSAAVAKQIANRGVIWITGFVLTPGGGAVAGVGGHQYSAHDIGLSLLLLPFAVVARVVGASSAASDFMFSLIDPIFGALLVVLFFKFALALSKSPRVSVACAAVLALCTGALPYAHATFDALPTAFFLLLGFYSTWSGISRSSWRMVLGGGCAAAGAVLVRVDSSIFVVVLLAWLGGRALHGGRVARVQVASFLAPLLGAGLVMAWYDWARFGQVFNNGHAHDPQTRLVTPLWYGLAGNYLSPGKGLLFFAPPIVLAALGWRTLVRRERGLAVAVLAGVIGYSLFVSKLANWSGAEAWGPRFLLPASVLLMLPLVYVLASWRTVRWPRWAAWSGVCAAGFVVQLVGASVWETAINRMYGGNLQATAFHRSEIWYALLSVWRGVRGHGPYPSTVHGGIVAPPVPPLDFWWLHHFPSYGRIAAVCVLALSALVGARKTLVAAVRPALAVRA